MRNSESNSLRISLLKEKISWELWETLCRTIWGTLRNFLKNTVRDSLWGILWGGTLWGTVMNSVFSGHKRTGCETQMGLKTHTFPPGSSKHFRPTSTRASMWRRRKQFLLRFCKCQEHVGTVNASLYCGFAALISRVRRAEVHANEETSRHGSSRIQCLLQRDRMNIRWNSKEVLRPPELQPGSRGSALPLLKSKQT